MSDTSFSVQISANGRIIIPAALRKQANLQEGNTIVLTIQRDNTIQMKKMDCIIKEAQSVIKSLFSEDDLMSDLKALKKIDSDV